MTFMPGYKQLHKIPFCPGVYACARILYALVLLHKLPFCPLGNACARILYALVLLFQSFICWTSRAEAVCFIVEITENL